METRWSLSTHDITGVPLSPLWAGESLDESHARPKDSATAAEAAATTVLWNDTANATDLSAVPLDANVALIVLKGFVMAAITLATLLGNVMVIVSVCKFRYLRVMNNYFIVSLAVADLLVGSVVMPFNMYNQLVSLRWDFGRVVCDIFNANDVWFTTASVLHLGFISIDRYMAIMSPFSYEKRMSRRRVFAMIAVTWILSLLLSYAPVFSGLYTTAEHLEKIRADPRLCDFKVSAPYAFVSSSISFWIPCATMIATYQKILREAMAQERHIRALQVHSADDGSAVVPNGTGGGAGGASGAQDSGDEDDEVASTAGRHAGRGGGKRGKGSSGGGVATSSLSHALRALLRRDSKQARKLRREHRAAKTLGLIMGVFVLCYLPFFTWYTLSFGVCPGRCAIEEAYVSVLFWLGYANSCANPLVYAFYNKDFQVAFRKLLFARGLSNAKKFSVSEDGADAAAAGGGGGGHAAERRSSPLDWQASS